MGSLWSHFQHVRVFAWANENKAPSIFDHLQQKTKLQTGQRVPVASPHTWSRIMTHILQSVSPPSPWPVSQLFSDFHPPRLCQGSSLQKGPKDDQGNPHKELEKGDVSHRVHRMHLGPEKNITFNSEDPLIWMYPLRSPVKLKALTKGFMEGMVDISLFLVYFSLTTNKNTEAHLGEWGC